MGSSPRIDGGMTQAEYQQVLAENRVAAAQQEELARQRALEDADRRREQEKIDAASIKAEELASIAELDAAESELIGEVDSQFDTAKELTPDFFSSLFLGSTSPTSDRPE